MVNILFDWQRHEFKFKGSMVAMELRQLSSQAALLMIGIEIDKPDKSRMVLISEIFNEHVRNIENLTINDNPAIPEDLALIAETMQLGAAVSNKLIEISNLSEADEKNSDRQSNLAKADAPLTS